MRLIDAMLDEARKEVVKEYIGFSPKRLILGGNSEAKPMTDPEVLRDQINKFEKVLATLVCLRPTIHVNSDGTIPTQILVNMPKPCPHCKALAMIAELRKELRQFEHSKE